MRPTWRATDGRVLVSRTGRIPPAKPKYPINPLTLMPGPHPTGAPTRPKRTRPKLILTHGARPPLSPILFLSRSPSEEKRREEKTCLPVPFFPSPGEEEAKKKSEMRELASSLAAAGAYSSSSASSALRGWWVDVNESRQWQDGAFFSLAAAYALVSAVALVGTPSPFSLLFSSLPS